MRHRLLVASGAALGLLAAVPGSAGEPTQQTWHGNQIHMYGAQAAGRYGAGVTVAVLDGWIDRSHPDFEGRVLAGADCRSGTCKAGLTPENCGAHHGTHVAGTVGASNLGVAPKSTILPVQVLSSDSRGECTGTPAAVAAGIRYAVAHGAKVLNLSLGPDNPGSTNAAIPTAVHQAAQAGAVVVFSAGNADLPVSQSYGTDALVVAATGPSGQLASYSQYGAGVTLAAPGGQPDSKDDCAIADCVLSLYPDNQLAVAAGTSMAAPHVSGLAALLFAQAPGRSRSTVIARIESTAHPLSGAGYGLVDVGRALGVRGSTGTPTPSRTPTHRPTTPATTKASPRPSTSQPTAPAPRPSPRPSPMTPTSGTPTTQPTPVPTPVVSAPVGNDDGVPVPLALGAGLLLLLAVGGVVRFGRR
ncbi:MAG: Proprotein convertase in/kexin type 6 [Frankiales bacterium]|nr:Proprotein convertase in/kexin type 6 [Frankiales bacterium]